VILRQLSSIFSSFGPALACALVLGFAASPALAQNDDLYGVPANKPGTTEETPSQPVQPVASPKKIAADSVPAPRVDSAAPVAPAVVPVVPAPDTVKPSRPRVITRETTVNPLDTRRGSYRNPKKALFMSLIVPGLGQAYVGQSAFNYSRAALYFGTEITLGALWYHYTVVKYDREVKRYRRYADEHWSQGAYEDAAFTGSAAESFADLNPYRAAYCGSVQRHGRGSAAEDALYNGCLDILDPDSATGPKYQNFKSQYDDSWGFGATPNPDSVGARRASYADRVDFYSLIGRYQEFVGGWDDVTGLAYTDSSIAGASANRDTYAAMRGRAQDYSRMQAWFIGGIALNHIASAIDAAITARRNNKHLYEGEARWYDRIGVDGGLAFNGGRPFTRMTASLSF
jgi:hypothetical protein